MQVVRLLIHGRGMVRPMIAVLTAWQCTFRLDFDSVAATRHAATLDTELVAKSYSGGNRTHLLSNHFQYALPCDC